MSADAVDEPAHPHREAVIHRQRRQRRPVVPENLLQLAGRLGDVRQEVPVGEHRALGASGRAAGVLQRQEIIPEVERRDRLSSPQPLRAELERARERLRGDGARGDHLLEPLHRLDDEPSCRREELGHAADQHRLDRAPRDDGRQLVGEQVDHEEELRPRVVQRERDLRSGVQRVDVDDHAAGLGRSEQEDRVGEAVGALDGDPLALLQTELEAQVGGELIVSRSTSANVRVPDVPLGREVVKAGEAACSRLAVATSAPKLLCSSSSRSGLRRAV